MTGATATVWPWAALVGLGAFHGMNPAMGWLFAVALGLQSGERGAVWRALPPIALGHAGAIVVAVTLVGVAQLAVDVVALRLLAAVGLIGFGIYRLARGYRHKVRAGMQAGFTDLMLWSFLMAIAHGAGFMVVPVLLALPPAAAVGAHDLHSSTMMAFGGSIWTGLVAVTVHTLAMLVVAGVIAWVIFTWVGLAVLRRGWINFDLIWSAVLIGTGAVFLVATGIDLAGVPPAHNQAHPAVTS